MMHTFGFIHLKSQFASPDPNFNQTIQAFSRALEKRGGQEWTLEEVSSSMPLLYFVNTGGSEEILLKIRNKRATFQPGEDVFLVAHPGYNSLPAALEVLARLQQDELQGRIFFLSSPEDQEGLDQITSELEKRKTSPQLKRSRLGLIGPPSNWLVASSPAFEVLKQNWGPEVIPVSIDELTELMVQVSEADIAPVMTRLVTQAREVREPSTADLKDAVSVYLALKKIIKKYELNALSLRCFDLVLGLKTTGCFALSQLIDDGVVAGCEGDLVTTVGMLWVKDLLGVVPWMANPARLDVKTNTIMLAHCTIAKSLVQDFGLRSHFESGLGVGIQGSLPKGPVTLLRLGGVKMEKLWLGEGEIIDVGQDETLCRTQVEIKLSTGHVEALLTNPLGNHVVMAQGHHRRKLYAWWKRHIDDAEQNTGAIPLGSEVTA